HCGPSCNIPSVDTCHVSQNLIIFPSFLWPRRLLASLNNEILTTWILWKLIFLLCAYHFITLLHATTQREHTRHVDDALRQVIDARPGKSPMAPAHASPSRQPLRYSGRRPRGGRKEAGRERRIAHVEEIPLFPSRLLTGNLGFPHQRPQ